MNVSYQITEEINGDLFYTVHAILDGNIIGTYIFKKTLPTEEPSLHPENTLVAIDAETEETYQRKGVASWAYQFIEEYTGLTIYNGSFVVRTQDGSKFWNSPKRKFGKS